MNVFLLTGIIGSCIGLWFGLPLLCVASGVMLGAGLAQLARK